MHGPVHSLLVAAAVVTASVGCTVPTKRPVKPRTPIEQLLISEAI
jgi:hypothetical protein